MKKINKILAIILAILMVISIVPITASAATSGKAGESIWWEIKNGVLGFSGSGEMNSYNSSNAPWSSYKNSIREIRLDEDITIIGDYAFYNLNITKVDLPKGIRQIGSYAFANCTSLSNIVMRKSVEVIDNNAFANCSSLTNVYYSSLQKDWNLINIREGNNYLLNANIIFQGVGTVTWDFDEETGTMTFTGDGVIPDYYNEEEDSFLIKPWDEIEKDIKHLVFNEGITSIGTYAFAHCTSLETITMSSVETIGHHAFYDCPVLKKLTTSNSLKVIGRQAFMDCTKFTYIYYSGTQEEWNNISIGDHWNDEMDKVKVYPSDYKIYSDCGTYQSVFGGNIFPWVFDAYSSTLTISGEGDLNWVFSLPWEQNKFDIKRLVFSDGVTSICSIVFKALPNLEEIVIPASVIEISEQAFLSDFLTDVYYTGTKEQWINIIIGEDNDALLNANIHYNYVECEHDFDISIVKEPTCEVRGYTTHICSICKDSYVDNFVVKPHEYDAVVTAPTCTKQGYTTYTCSVCGYSEKDDYTSSTGHDYKVSEITSPTCTANGYIKYTCAKGCGSSKKEKTESSLGHDYGTTVEIIEPTCTEKGYTKQTCTRCKNVNKYDYVDALGHNYIASSTTSPTCTKLGYTSYTCTHCSETYKDDYVNSLGHIFEWKITVEPTCTNNGTKTGVCSVCGDETTETVSNLGHDLGEYQVDIAPTCTKNGRESRHCSRCDYKYSPRDIPAAHSYGDWEQVTEGACREYARFERICTACGSINVMDAPIEHKYESVVTAPTCTEKGYTTYICTACGDSYVDDFVDVDANNHSYTSEITTQATHLTTGVETFTCTCGDSYTETIDKIADHTYESAVTVPTCTEQGYTTYTCECGDNYIAEYVDALGHTSANAVEENYVAPTCTESGSKDVVVYCSVCEEEISRETVVLDATGHEDNDGDGYCDTCDEKLCDHRCHKSGIAGFFWKITNAFNIIFRINKVCECGVAHY